MKKLLLLSLVLSTLTACSTLQRMKSDKVLSQATVNKSDFFSEITYETKWGIQIFNVTIEGKPYRFMFDSGGYTVLSAELVRSLKGITQKSTTTVQDANSVASDITTYMLEEMIIGGVPFSDVGFAKIGFTESEWFSCLGLDGTLGTNIMKECLWLFDDESKRIILTDNASKLSVIQNSIKVPIQVSGVFKPKIDFQIDQFKGEAGFDTGFNGLIGLVDQPKHPVFLQSPSAVRLGARNNGGNSTTYTNSKVMKLDAINFNGLMLKNVIASIRSNASSSLLGSEIFEYYKVVIDLNGKTMYFKAIPTHPMTKTNIESFGLGFDFRGGKLVVDYVYESSTAREKGIEPGEEIIKINGKAPIFSDYCAFVNQFDLSDEDKIELEFSRNNKPFKVTLIKEKIL